MNVFPDGRNVVSKHLYGRTQITETVEPSDPDELLLMSTIITRTIEPIDPDEILLDSTRQTATLEPIDPDEIVV